MKSQHTFQASQWLESCGSNEQPRGILELIRAFPWNGSLWNAPGIGFPGASQSRNLGGKVAADVVEALIGVVYETLGPSEISYWLAYLGLLPGHPKVSSHRWGQLPYKLP
jgi:hypothetical protein